MAKKQCDFCNGEYEPDYTAHRNGYCIWLEVNTFDGEMTFMAQANDDLGEMIEDYIPVPMNYCPVCGRKVIT